MAHRIQTKQVALLVETSRAYGRGLLSGIARYHQDEATWATYFQPQGLGEPVPKWLSQGNGDDQLTGNSSAPSVLVGLGGSDTLVGGNGRDVLIGGDVLIAGGTIHDQSAAALLAILDE